MSTISNYLDNIANKRPSELLDPRFANDLYDTVPTDAENFEGYKIMGYKTSPTPYIKLTALEPAKGVIYHVPGGTRTPVSQKQAFQTKKEIVVRFADSHLFSHDDLQAFAEAERQDARDAEMRLAAETIVNAAASLKFRNAVTQEKLFWEGCWQQRMDIEQYIDNVVSERRISTNTRALTALTGNDRWNIAAASSTADPTSDIRAMAESFTGKGGKLGTVYMNLATFNEMIATANATTGLRSNLRYTTADLEQKAFEDGIMIGGAKIKIYNEGYLDKTGTYQMFIPDGYIIGIGAQSASGSFVDRVESLNIDAMEKDTFKIGSVFGTYFRVKTEDDPISRQLLLSHCGLPVFRNPQQIVSLQVY